MPVLALALLLAACSGSSSGQSTAESTQIPLPVITDPYAVGKPLQRNGIGDVDLAIARYEATRADLIAKFQVQPWFQDGLTRDESLFVERSISFVGRYSGPRIAYISDETIERKLYLYEVVPLSRGDLELLLIYEPGQNAALEMRLLKDIVPALEAQIGVPYPEKVVAVINGEFEINDFNEGQFIRIARCCLANPFILAHELAHTYWTIGPSWFNEGMADLTAVMLLERLDADPPEEWGQVNVDLEAYIDARRRYASLFPDMILPERFASDGLYEGADVLLYDIRSAIGAEAFAEAAREIYLASDYDRVGVSAERIESVFLDHAGDDAAATVQQLFNHSIWGDDGETFQRYQELESLNP